jgi:hypothetical protein
MENWAKTDTTTPQAPTKQPTSPLNLQQPQLTTHRAPHHKEDQLNEPTTRNGSIKQAAVELSR